MSRPMSHRDRVRLLGVLAWALAVALGLSVAHTNQVEQSANQENPDEERTD